MHPVDFQTRDEVLVKAGAVMRRYHDSGLEFKTSFDPSPRLTSTRPSWTSTAMKRYEGWGGAHGGALERISAAYKLDRPAGCPCCNDALAENFMLRASRCGSSTGSTAA